MDSRAASIKATQEAFVEFGLPMPSEAMILHNMGIPIERSFPIMGAGAYPASRHAEILDRFRAIYGPICDRETTVYPDIKEVLTELRNAALSFIIVTSKKSTVTLRTLNQVGLAHFFPNVIGSDHVKNFKPHPEPALTAAALFGMPKAEMLV